MSQLLSEIKDIKILRERIKRSEEHLIGLHTVIGLLEYLAYSEHEIKDSPEDRAVMAALDLIRLRYSGLYQTLFEVEETA